MRDGESVNQTGTVSHVPFSDESSTMKVQQTLAESIEDQRQDFIGCVSFIKRHSILMDVLHRKPFLNTQKLSWGNTFF